LTCAAASSELWKLRQPLAKTQSRAKFPNFSKFKEHAAMSEEHKEPWLNYLAITTVVLAVFATLATYNGGKYSTRSVIAQNQASDQWAYYQSKSIKSYQYELQIDKLELDLKAMLPESSARVQDDFRKKIDSYKAKIQKYEGEKAEIQAEAKRLEEYRNDCQCHGKYFGFGIIYLQIGILLCAVAGFTKNKYLWYLSIVLGVVGIYFFAMGFYAKPLPLPISLPSLPLPGHK
jgi:hypothetical protein